jgi:hypothetical protein
MMIGIMDWVISKQDEEKIEIKHMNEDITITIWSSEIKDKTEPEIISIIENRIKIAEEFRLKEVSQMLWHEILARSMSCNVKKECVKDYK